MYALKYMFALILNADIHENTQVMQGIIASLILFNAILLIAHFEKNYKLIQERNNEINKTIFILNLRF